MRAFFYDTWAFVALANRGDPHHELAADADRALAREGYVATTSDYVLDETLTLLHAAAGARVATMFADLLEERMNADNVLLLEVTAPRREAGLELFRRLAPDVPRLSFTDCTSFAVMTELGIEIAFTADRHFTRPGAGIRPLIERHGRKLGARLS